MSSVILESSKNSNGNLVLNTVIITDTDKIPHQFIFPASITLKNIRAEIQRFVDSVVTSDTTAKSLQPGVMDLTPIVDDPPKDELDRRKFAADVLTLKSYFRGVDIGVIQPDDSNVLDLEKSLKSRFIVSYVDLL